MTDTTTQTRREFLARRLRDFLETPRAAELRDGAAAQDEEWEVITGLSLRYEGNRVDNPLTQPSRRALARLIQNPRQAVCSICDGPWCALHHVDPASTAEPHVMENLDINDLPADLFRRYRGMHQHTHITILRDLDGDYAIWSTSDPTKGGAWHVSEIIDLDEARAAVAASRAVGLNA